jgi:hypothetical protein
MRHLSLCCFLSLVSAATAVVGCADPNPTFIFDAAPAAPREGGTAGAAGGSGGAAGQPGAADAGIDGAGDTR